VSRLCPGNRSRGISIKDRLLAPIATWWAIMRGTSALSTLLIGIKKMVGSEPGRKGLESVAGCVNNKDTKTGTT